MMTQLVAQARREPVYYVQAGLDGRFVRLFSLRCYAAFIGSYLPTFPDNLLVPYTKPMSSSTASLFKMGLVNCPETSLTNYQSTHLRRAKTSFTPLPKLEITEKFA